MDTLQNTKQQEIIYIKKKLINIENELKEIYLKLNKLTQEEEKQKFNDFDLTEYLINNSMGC